MAKTVYSVKDFRYFKDFLVFKILRRLRSLRCKKVIESKDYKLGRSLRALKEVLFNIGSFGEIHVYILTLQILI